MYRKIFCPVDGSEISNRGLREAILLAKDQKAELMLLHVVDLTPLAAEGPTFGTDFEALRDVGRSALHAAVEEAKVHGITPLSRLVEVMSGAPGIAIVNEVGQYGPDVIVMGTHGRRGLSRLLMGSDAATVVGEVRIPVLLVK